MEATRKRARGRVAASAIETESESRALDGLVVISVADLKEVVREVVREELGRSAPLRERPRYVTAKTFAAELGITSHAVRQWCRDGMPSKRVGASVRVIRDEAMLWLDTANKRVKR